MLENFPTGKSLLYRLFTSEHEEIERLKWFESEKAGKDIGLDHAFWIWNTRYRRDWLKEQKKKII